MLVSDDWIHLARIERLTFCTFDVDHAVIDKLSAVLDRDLAAHIGRRVCGRIHCGCGVKLCFCCAGLVDDHGTAAFDDHGGVVSDSQFSAGGIGPVFDSQRRIISDRQSCFPLFHVVGDLNIKTVNIQND